MCISCQATDHCSRQCLNPWDIFQICLWWQIQFYKQNSDCFLTPTKCFLDHKHETVIIYNLTSTHSGSGFSVNCTDSVLDLCLAGVAGGATCCSHRWFLLFPFGFVFTERMLEWGQSSSGRIRTSNDSSNFQSGFCFIVSVKGKVFLQVYFGLCPKMSYSYCHTTERWF